MDKNALEARNMVEKNKKREIAESWHHKQEKLIKSWGEKCLGYRWLLHRNAQYHSKINRNLSISNISLSTVASLGTLMGTSLEGGSILLYVFGFINLVSVGIASVHKFLRSGEQFELNIQTSKQFSRLARDISLELSLEKEDRMDAVNYCNKVREEYDKIMDRVPEIPNWVIQEYKKTMEKDDPNGTISRPDIANGKFKIYSSSEGSNQVV